MLMTHERASGDSWMGVACFVIGGWGEVVLSQQAHEVVGGVGVEPQGRGHDVGGGMCPVLVVVVHAVQHRVGQRRLCMDHLT